MVVSLELPNLTVTSYMADQSEQTVINITMEGARGPEG